MNFSEARIKKMYAHFVGNKLQDSGVIISKRAIEITDSSIASLLKDSLLSPFIDKQEFFQFTHPSSLKYNEVHGHTTAFFSGEINLNKTSAEIAKHLYENSVHPKIKPGELLVVHFENCILENKSCDAIGIFKTVAKNNFLRFTQDDSQVSFDVELGVEPQKGFQKACLIFNIDKKSGHRLAVIDGNGKSIETQYWKENFLQVIPCSDNYHYTENYLKVCKQFVEDRLPEEYEVSKADQIDFLNKSISYFRENDQFEEAKFAKSVFRDPEVIESFREFKEDYSQRNDISIEDSFEVSNSAVKKQNRVFKSVLKLDSNFHIYIHGNRELIEKGEDNNGRKFYKIYYDEEL